MENHVCPVWVGYLLASPIRKLYENPNKLLSQYIKTGMTVMDFGSAMGFFTLPMARMVGESGKIVCVDIQKKMLEKLEKRAKKAKLLNRLEMFLISENNNVAEKYMNSIDFVLASAVVHEVPDADLLLDQLFCVLKKGGRILITEPAGHVKEEDFEKNIEMATEKGFEIIDRTKAKRSFSVLLEK